MQFEIAHASCPLCKRPLSASAVDLAPGTRLCDKCRTIVQTAFAGAHSRIAPTASAAHNNGSRAVSEPAPALDCSPVDSSSFAGHFDTAERLEDEAESLNTFELYNDLAPEPDLRTDLPDFSETGLIESISALSPGGFQARVAHDDLTQPALLDEEASTLSDAASSPGAQVSLFDDQCNHPQPSEDENAVDPWQNPLPAWDYSHSEWPVLVGPSRRRTLRGLRVPLAALVLLACAAAIYSFVYRPSSSEQGTTTVQHENAAVKGQAASGETQPSEAAQLGASLSSSYASSSADLKPAQAASVEPPDSSDPGGAEGKFSLQAAAFPNQAAAQEFADKLKNAGVPAYIVSTDLARRGRWFRVRIGRFNAADEAQKFAAEAQMRARSAGMSLQLIACQYERP